jgi:hypothetical protein
MVSAIVLGMPVRREERFAITSVFDPGISAISDDSLSVSRGVGVESRGFVLKSSDHCQYYILLHDFFWILQCCSP